jgi:hypothetical protein
MNFRCFFSTSGNHFPFILKNPQTLTATHTVRAPSFAPERLTVGPLGPPVTHRERHGGGISPAAGSPPSDSPQRGVVPKTWPNEIGVELIGAHGGATVLAQGGWPKQASTAATRACASSARWRRTRNSRKGGRDRAEEG